MATVPFEDTDYTPRSRWSDGMRLAVASAVWLLALGAALVAALARGGTVEILGPLALAAAAPAVLSLALSPIVEREWAQVTVILGWLALAIVACLAVAWSPMALLFLAAPAAAALFRREKVVEATVLAAVFAGLIWFVGREGALPQSGLGGEGARWAAQAGIVATVMFLATAMFGAASREPTEVERPTMDVLSRASLLRAVPGAVLSINGADQVDFASRDAMDLFAISSDFGVMPTSALLSNDIEAAGRLHDLLRRVRAQGIRDEAVFETRDRSGLRHTLHVTASPVDGDRLLVQARDITDREEQMDALRRQRVADEDTTPDRSLFFAGVSHELRTPLNAIIGFSDMMRSRMFGPLPGRYAEYADLIHDSGQHMLDLIGDVLDLSKVEAGKYELQTDIFDVGDVVRSSVKMVRPLADTAEVVLALDVPEDDMLLEADRKAVRQILLNLLSNAVKFSPPGGRVEVTLESVGEDVVISVEDGGPGMSAEEIRRIGEPFAQGASARLTEERGSGLGLALVARLVGLHGGRFTIESEGGGTLATVSLPRSR